MKLLWAPWRVEYIEAAGKIRGCVFCNAARKKTSDLVLSNGNLSLVMLNKYPYSSAHLLIAPKRHVANIEELSPKESADLIKKIKHSVKILKKAYKPEGFNIGMNLGKAAGAGIKDHLHWHIVPRWNGDTNFMPLIAEVKVLPEHLLKTLEKLKPLFEKIL